MFHNNIAKQPTFVPPCRGFYFFSTNFGVWAGVAARDTNEEKGLRKARRNFIGTRRNANVIRFTAVIKDQRGDSRLSADGGFMSVLGCLINSASRVRVVLLGGADRRVDTGNGECSALVFTPSDRVLIKVKPRRIARRPHIERIDKPRRAAGLIRTIRI